MSKRHPVCCRKRKWLRHHFKPQTRWRVSRTNIVVSSDKHNLQVLMVLTPYRKRAKDRIGAPTACMDQIPRDDQTHGSAPFEKHIQGRKVALDHFRNRNARGTKGRRLPKMNISDHQRTMPRPIQRTLRVQLKVFIMP